MLKKIIALWVVLSLSVFLVYAQVSSSGELKTQHIQWKAVDRSGGYTINLQQKTAEGWEDCGSWTIEEPEFDFELASGFYRFNIVVLNRLGKPAGTSDWAEFEIVDDDQPVLHRQSFPISDTYGVPVISRSIEDDNGTEIISVRGLNCFTTYISFSLVPVDSSDGSKPFKALERGQKLQLPVVGFNEETHSISLSLDWSCLVPGYYNLLVENSSGGSDAFEVLVQPEHIPQIDVSSLPYDAITDANYLDVISSDGAVTIDVSKIQYNTEFVLEPVSNPENPYAFESGFSRQTVSTEWVSYDDGDLSIRPDISLLKPGWYRLIGTTPGAGSSDVTVLYQADSSVSSLPEIKDISCKLNNSTQVISLTVELEKQLFMQNDLGYVRLFAISEKDDFGENSRTQLHVSSVAKNGKSAVYESTTSSILPGCYAIMLETEKSARIVFIEINDKYRASLVSLSDDEINRRFLIAPTDEVLAMRRAEREKLIAEGMTVAEYLPAFKTNPQSKWSWSARGSFPGDMSYENDSLFMSVRNIVGNTPYESVFRLLDNDTLEMIQHSEGISFESMVTERNNGKTKWKLSVEVGGDVVEIPVESSLRRLSQNIVVWSDYGIQSSDITGVKLVVQAKNPREAGWDNTLEIYEAKTYSPGEAEEQVIINKPLFLTRVGAYAALCLGDDCPELYSIPYSVRYQDDRLSGSGVPSSIRLSLFDTGWFAFNAVFMPAGMGAKSMFGGEVMVALDNDWAKPYAGYGKSFSGKLAYDEFFAGVLLCKYLDVRYSYFAKASMDDSNVSRGWHSQWLQVGASVPLRKAKEETILVPPASTRKTWEPVLFTDALIKTTVPMNVLTLLPSYRLLIPDTYAGLRAIGTKYFAMDVWGGLCSIPAFDMDEFYAYNIQANMLLQLPFSLFGVKFTPYAGVGAGYRISHCDVPDEVFGAPVAGISIGKYVSFFLEGFMGEKDLKKASDLMSEAPILAPASFIISCRNWNIGVSVSIPLRGNK